MSLNKVIDNYTTTISGNYTTTDTTITVATAPTVITAGYLIVYDFDGNVYEKIKFTGVSSNDLTGCLRGLSFTTNSDSEITANKKELKDGMVVKMAIVENHINDVYDVINGDSAFEGVPKNPSARTISDQRHLVDKEYADAISTTGITSLAVSDNGGITVNVNSGWYSINATIAFYAGASNQSLTDDSDNYIELVSGGTLNISTSAFSNDALPLAKVTCASGDITVLEDARVLSVSDLTEDEKDALAGTAGTPSSTNKYVTNDDTTGTGDVVRESALASFSKTLTAGEDFTGGTLPQPVFIGKGTETLSISELNDNDSSQSVVTTSWLAQTFTATNLRTISKVLVALTEQGTAAGTFTMGIYATSGGQPTGSPLATKDLNAATEMSSGNVEFELASELSITPGDVYAIVLSNPGGTDNSNDFNWYYDNTSPYTDGAGFTSADSGSSWLAFAGGDFNFQVDGKEDIEEGKVYICDANDSDRLSYVGFISDTETSGNDVDVQFNGIVDGFSGLSIGSLYYVQDDKTLGTSAGSNSIIVGRAISATEIIIKNY